MKEVCVLKFRYGLQEAFKLLRIYYPDIKRGKFRYAMEIIIPFNHSTFWFQKKLFNGCR